MPRAIAQTALAVLGIPLHPVHAPVHGGRVLPDAYHLGRLLNEAEDCAGDQLGSAALRRRALSQFTSRSKLSFGKAGGGHATSPAR